MNGHQRLPTTRIVIGTSGTIALSGLGTKPSSFFWSVEADEVHHFHVGHVGDVRVVGRAGREVGADRAGENRSSGARGTDAGAQHHGNKRGAHGGGAARSRRNGDVHEERDHRADGNEEDAEAADRAREIVNERAVGAGVLGDEGKTHRAADCHHEGGIRHRLREGVEAAHQVPGNEAEEETRSDQHESCFISLDESVYHSKDCQYGNPFSYAHGISPSGWFSDFYCYGLHVVTLCLRNEA